MTQTKFKSNLKFKNYFFIFLFFLFLLSSSIIVLGQSNLPANLQKINDYNQSSAEDFALKISFLIAFIAGMLTILSPCILPFIPAYLTYAFKEKKNITKMTFIFFLGFSSIFVLMGIVAGFIGEKVLMVVQKNWVIYLAGIFMIALGLLTIKGKKVCTYFNAKKKFSNDTYGTFLFGMFFAMGWTACLGPILAGILGLGAILGDSINSGILLFFYSLGNLVPLFLISVAYDKFKLADSKLIQGKYFTIKLFGKEILLHTTNLFSGILFIVFGLILLIFQGTALFNTWDILGTKRYFYSIQRVLIDWPYANLLGGIILGLFVFFMVRFFLIGRRKEKNKQINEVKPEQNQEPHSKFPEQGDKTENEEGD